MSFYLTCVGVGVGELLVAACHEAESGEVLVLLLALGPCFLNRRTRATSTGRREVDVAEGRNTSTYDHFLDLPRGLVPP